MGGLPCIAGTCIPVAMLVRMVAAGTPVEAILEDDPRDRHGCHFDGTLTPSKW